MSTNENKKIIELLQKIKDELKETRSLIKDECSQIKQILQDIDEEENEWTCDQCEQEYTDDKPYKEVNKYQFCSASCWDEWKENK